MAVDAGVGMCPPPPASLVGDAGKAWANHRSEPGCRGTPRLAVSPPTLPLPPLALRLRDGVADRLRVVLLLLRALHGAGAGPVYAPGRMMVTRGVPERISSMVNAPVQSNGWKFVLESAQNVLTQVPFAARWRYEGAPEAMCHVSRVVSTRA